MKTPLLGLTLSVLLTLTAACSQDEHDSPSTPRRQATVTLLVTPNGLGDNGYDDDAANGIFAFMEESGVPVRLLQPRDMQEAETLYRQWRTLHATADSAVLVAGSSAYADLLRRLPPALAGRGSRVLLFESDEPIDGVTTVMINRYGAAYLAGAMAKDFDAFILAAAPGFPTLEDAISGFRAGHSAHSDASRTIALQYLAEGEEGFAMPDSAFHTLYRRAQQYLDYDEIIFPLLGGSGAGVTAFLNSDALTAALSIGIDVDQAGQSSRIPYSLVIHIGNLLKTYLADWQAGKPWPATRRLGLADGATDIVLTPNFVENLNIWDDRYEDIDAFQRLYHAFHEEAEKQEAAHEQP